MCFSEDKYFSCLWSPFPLLHEIHIFRGEGLRRCRCNPFLFITGLSCPSSVQTSLTQNCLKGARAWDIRVRVINTERSYLDRWLEDWTKKSNLCKMFFFTDDWVCGKNYFLFTAHSVWGKKPTTLAWKSGLKVPLLPSANYSYEWSGWVWQPSADSNGRLAQLF